MNRVPILRTSPEILRPQGDLDIIGGMSGAETSTDSIEDDLSAAFSPDDSPSGDTSTPPAEASAQATVSGEPKTALEPPRHWPEADRTLFAKAPPEIQQRWIAREGETQKGLDQKFQEIAGFRREREQLDEMFAPFARDLELGGTSRTQFIGSLLGAHRYLRESPKEAVLWLCEQYGVDPAVLNAPSEANPQLEPLIKGFQTLEQKVNGFFTQQQQAEHATNLSRVQQFAEAKDEKGTLLHPYFDEVAEDVLALIRAQPQGRKDIDLAYKKAVRMNDAVWEKEQTRMGTVKAAATQDAKKAEIDKAKRAGVTSKSKEANGTTRPSTLRDELEAGFADWTP